MILEGLTSKITRFLSWWCGNRKGPVEELPHLPLVIIPAKGQCRRIAIFYSGDGGWANLTSEVSAALSEQAIGVIGIDSMRYFWKEKSPEQAAEDLLQMTKHFQKEWNCTELIAIGYSMGADVLPGILLNVSEETRSKITHTVLLSLSTHVKYHFRFIGWLGYTSKPQESENILLQLENLKLERLLCVCGSKEINSLCYTIDPSIATKDTLPGAHHYGSDYYGLSKRVIRFLDLS